MVTHRTLKSRGGLLEVTHPNKNQYLLTVEEL